MVCSVQVCRSIKAFAIFLVTSDSRNALTSSSIFDEHVVDG